jgi:hypothetical protein
MAKRGRRRIFSDNRKRAKVLGFLRAGGSRGDAAKSVGTTHKTLCDECNRDPQFAMALDDAELSGKLRLLRIIQSEAGKNAKYACWLLERKFPNEFGRRAADVVTPAELVSAISMFVSNVTSVIPAECRVDVQRQLTLVIDRLSERHASVGE